MADFGIWSKLPIDLLYELIKHTTDALMLVSWSRVDRLCRAVVDRRLNSQYFINEAVLRNFTTIEDQVRHRQILQDISQLYRFEPRYYKSAFLSFRFGLDPFWGEDLLVSEDIESSLSKTLPRLTSLERITHLGVLYQEFLAQVVNVGKLKVLSLRKEDHLRLCASAKNALDVRPNSDLALDFTVIEKLAGLRTLNIRELLPGEGHGLGIAIRKLYKLSELSVHVFSLGHPFHRLGNRTSRISPLDALIEAIYPCPTTFALCAPEYGNASGFPISLQELAFVDNYSTFLDARNANPLFDVLLPYRPTVEYWSFDAWHYLSNRAYYRKLEQLWDMPIMYRQLRSEGSYDIRHREIRPGQDYLRIYMFEKRLPKPRTATKTNAQSSNTQKDGTLYAADPNHQPAVKANTNRDTSKAKGRSIGCESGSWGPGFRHMHLEAVNIPYLVVDNIRPVDGSLDALKILILSPKRDTSTLEPRPTLFILAQKIARAILRERLPSLRVVVIDKHKFWLHPSVTQQNDGKRLWRFYEALRDSTVGPQVEQILTRDDWVFFAPSYGTMQEINVGSMIVRRATAPLVNLVKIKNDVQKKNAGKKRRTVEETEKEVSELGLRRSKRRSARKEVELS
ncbi:hypothetical protein MMC18_003828 [Xylographa bjoerkii]|nr:hypothetical protein [Xylographa bjoerkii]